MSTYVLIHGSWQGGWCWKKIIPFLENKGHKVVAPDLPGHGSYKTPVQDISLQAYVDEVCEILDAQSEPVILVGHSLGGVVISQAAEYRPDKIRKLVYLSAFLLKNGECLMQYAEQDTDALALPNLIMADDQLSATFNEDALKDAFYGDCSDEDVLWAKSLLTPQAAAPFMTPIHTTEENFGRIPRVYISCLRDRGVSLALQEKMYTHVPCEKVIKMDTSHSPNISTPEDLAENLLSLA